MCYVVSCWVSHVKLPFNQINQIQCYKSKYILNVQPDFHIIGEKHCHFFLLTEIILKEEEKSAENEGSIWVLYRVPPPTPHTPISATDYHLAFKESKCRK